MNEVTIFIRARNEASAVITAVTKQLKDMAKEAGGTAKEVDRLGDASSEAAGKQARLGGTAKEVTREVGRQSDKVDDLGRKLRRVSTGTYNVKVDVDKDGKLKGAFGKISGMFGNLVTTAGDAAEKIGEKFVGILPGAIGSAFQAAGPIVQTAMVAIGAVIVAALASFVATGLAAGILAALGGGVLAAGIASAVKSDKIDEILNGKKVVTRSAINAAPQYDKNGKLKPRKINMGDDVETREGGIIPKLKDAFTSFGTPFIDPLARALDKVNSALDKMGPKLSEIANKFAPIIDILAPAIQKMAENTWPGLQAALDASIPLFQTLADTLPALGAALGYMFQVIADHGPEANDAFSKILNLIGILIVAVAKLFSWLMSAYEAISKLKNAIANSSFGSFLAGPINALISLIGLLDRAISKKNQLDSAGGSMGRSLANAVANQYGNAGLSAARATGGIAGGMTRVAERGGELIRLPQGSMVYASGQSQQMMQQSAGGSTPGKIALELRITGNGGGALSEWFMKAQRTGEVQILATALP